MTDDYDADEIAVVESELGGIEFYPGVESAEEIAEKAERVSDDFAERHEVVGTLDEYVDKVVEHVNGYGAEPKGVIKADAPYAYPHDEEGE